MKYSKVEKKLKAYLKELYADQARLVKEYHALNPFDTNTIRNPAYYQSVNVIHKQHRHNRNRAWDINVYINSNT